MRSKDRLEGAVAVTVAGDHCVLLHESCCLFFDCDACSPLALKPFDGPDVKVAVRFAPYEEQT